jgi:hypothetical protein
MESRQPEETGSNADLVRSAALSSADLWHEILERLNEVQEGQLRLARAIESLGLIVCDALSVNPHAALSGGEPTSMARTAPRVQLAAGPPTQPTFTSDPAATQRAIDSLLSSDVFTTASPPTEVPKTPDVHTTPDVHKTPDVPAAAPAGSVSSPRFYVAPVSEESRKVTRQPVASGSWPRGRRVARGLGREAPDLPRPALVPNLTPAAIDALLAAEFGDASTGSSPPPRVVHATEAGPLLTTLLGAEFDSVAASRPATPVDPTPAPKPTAQPAAPTPPVPPSSIPRPARSPQAMSAASPIAPPAPAPVVTPPQSTQWSPTTDARRPIGTSAPAAQAPPPPPVSPRPTPTAGPSPLLPPPVPSAPAGTPPTPTAAPPAPPAPPAPAGLRTSVGPGPSGAPDPVPRRSPLDAATPNPAPFMAPGTPPTVTPPLDTAAPAGASEQANAMEMSQPTKRPDSAASMATEILSASPHVQAAEPTEPKPTMMAEDVTIMAKGRRRRFRLR